MTIKRYVVEIRQPNSDGDLLAVIKVYESKPHKYDYLIWI